MSNKERFAEIKAKITDLEKQKQALKEELQPIATAMLAELSKELTEACNEYYDFCLEDKTYYIVGYEELNAFDEEAVCFEDEECYQEIERHYDCHNYDEMKESHIPHLKKLNEIQDSILSIAQLLSLTLYLDYGKLRGSCHNSNYWEFGTTVWDGDSWYNSNC